MTLRPEQQPSATNVRLRRPSWATSLAENAIASDPAAAAVRASLEVASRQEVKVDDATSGPACGSRFRVVLGLGPGRSGTKSLAELIGSQTSCIRADHEMVVPRGGRGGANGVKGSWGADRRLEWDAPRLARGEPERTEHESAAWRVTRLLDQREAWMGWIAEAGQQSNKTKPKKLGARGWREYNRRNSSASCAAAPCTDAETGTSDSRTTSLSAPHMVPIVAAVGSAALAYVHEYVALDPSVRIVVVNRTREEVVASFLRKSVGRNHWQQPARDDLCSEDDGSTHCPIRADKTWDNAFPNMTDEECQPFLEQLVSVRSTLQPSKAAALRSYWELYDTVAQDLARQYPANVRLFDMATILNQSAEQEAMLRWCGFNKPILDFGIRLNKSPKTSEQ